MFVWSVGCCVEYHVFVWSVVCLYEVWFVSYSCVCCSLMQLCVLVFHTVVTMTTIRGTTIHITEDVTDRGGTVQSCLHCLLVCDLLSPFIVLSGTIAPLETGGRGKIVDDTLTGSESLQRGGDHVIVK